MRYRFYLLLVALLTVFNYTSAQESESSGQESDSISQTLNQERLTKTLLELSGADVSEVENVDPILDSTYLRVGPENVFSATGNKGTEYKMIPNEIRTITEENSFTHSLDIGYLYSVCKAGHVKAASDVVFNVYFNKTQYQIVKTNIEGNSSAKSAVFGYSDSKIPDITNEYFISTLRNSSTSDMDIINGYVSNNTRRNEVFQSFVDVNALDYNDDGTDDLFLFLGNTLYVYDGNTLEQIFTYQLTNNTNNSPSSVIADFNGDGIDDYLCLEATMSSYSYQNAEIKGLYIGSVYDASTNKLTYSAHAVEMNGSDVAQHDKCAKRAMLTTRLFYPYGKSNVAKLLIALTEIRYYEKDGSNYYNYFDHTLTCINVSGQDIESDNANGWYTVDVQKRERTVCQLHSSTGYWIGSKYERKRPYYFGHPALGTAFIDGINNPQLVFWINKVYECNEKDQTFTQLYEIPNLHENNNTGFDRVVGGQVEAQKTENSINKGREMFVFHLADSDNKEDKGTLYDDFDWRDTDYKVACLWRDLKLKAAPWYIVASNSIQETSGSPLTLSLTAVHKGQGALLKLMRRDVISTNPVIGYVLAAPPYIKGLTIKPGSVAFTKSSSSSSSNTDATTWRVGGGFDVSAKFGGIFTVSVHTAIVHSWTSQFRSTVTESESRGSGTQSGEDYVVFYYMPADQFTYKVIKCATIPEMVGEEFKIVKVRSTGMLQKGMSVTQYNEMVKGTTCRQIGENVISHTVGDVGSYKHGAYDEATMRSAFKVDKTEYFRYSAAFDAPEEDADETVALTYSKGGGEDVSEATNIDVTVSLGIGKQEWAWGGGVFATGGWTTSWTQSKSWDDTYRIDAKLPNVYNPKDNNYTYCLVWYRHHTQDSSGTDLENYMVANWYVLEDNTTTKLPLSDIIKTGTENGLYTVTDTLTAVYKSSDGSMIFAKDKNCYTPRQERGGKDDPYSNADFDQSNWIRLKGVEGLAFGMSDSKAIIPGGTLRGYLTRDEQGNPTLNIFAKAIPFSDGNTFTGNKVNMANFALTQGEDAQNVYLITPKPYEYVYVENAILNDDKTKFYMPSAATGLNDHNLVGEAKIDWSMEDDIENKFSATGENTLYNFYAIAYRNKLHSSTLPKEATADGGWTLIPINGTFIDNIPTQIVPIDTESKTIAKVRYFNLMGIECTNPTTGIFVRVTTYTDGTTKSEKIFK